MSLVRFSELRSPDAGGLTGDGRRVIGLIGLGAVEQHGPHLPLATDWIIAEHLVVAIAERIREPVLVAPVLPGGLSTHHLAFPGTVHLPEEVVSGFVAAYIEAYARIGVTDVALISSHGGNFFHMGELARSYAGGASRVIAYDDLPRYLKVMAEGAATRGVDVPETDAHAGGLETSQMKFLRGVDSIDMDPDLTGYVEGEEGWLDILLQQGIDALSPIGVLGDPSISTAEAGEAICAALADELAGWIAAELGATLVDAVSSRSEAP